MDKKIVCLFVLLLLIPVFSSCHSRSMTDIKPAMTKEKVISLWGTTNLISHKNVEGLGDLEIWDYHFESSDTICSVIFVQNRVARTECRPETKR
jgi:hypothetical protein